MAGGAISDKIDRLNVFSFDGRLESYRLAKWPQFKSSKPNGAKYKITPESMAAAGFFAKPIGDSLDNACCGYCRKNLDGWGPVDVAWDEHVSHSGVCPLVSLGEQVNRELTFTLAGWPHSGSIGPSKMAKAGFFYWPKLEEEDDTAICVQCGLALDGWEPNDDPRHEHSRRRPKCPFLVTGQTHSPTHYELLLASKNTDDALREWGTEEMPPAIKVVAPPTVTKKGKTAKAASPPKFRMPSKPAGNAAVPTVTKPVVVQGTPKKPAEVSSTPKRPVPEPTGDTTVKRTRVARRSTIVPDAPVFQEPVSARRSARRSSVRPVPEFKAPEADMSMMSLLPSVQATPLTRRTRKQAPRISSIASTDGPTIASAVVLPVPAPVDHLAPALKEVSSLGVTEADLDKPLAVFLETLIQKRLDKLDAAMADRFKQFEALVE